MPGSSHRDRVRTLILMEATLPGLPGGFTVPPWWFGFHAVPGLAETVLIGHEREYLEWFLPGVPSEIRDAFVQTHTGREALGDSLGFYRVSERNAAAIRAAGRLTMPTLALGGNVVGDLPHRQLDAVTDTLTGEIIERSGHLIPVDRPDAVADRLLAHTSRQRWEPARASSSAVERSPGASGGPRRAGAHRRRSRAGHRDDVDVRVDSHTLRHVTGR